MTKQMKKILLRVSKYRQGFLPILPKNVGESHFIIEYDRYVFQFQWLTCMPFGQFFIFTKQKINAFELTYESDYRHYGSVNKTIIKVLFSSGTDNAGFINRIIEETIFPTV